MLPFLQPKKMSAVIIAKRKPDGSQEPMQEEGGVNPALMSAAEDLISAVHAKDAMAVAKALEAADQIMDASEESEEGEE